MTEYSYSLEHEGKLLASGGFRLINLTTAWTWFDQSHHAGHHIVSVIRVVKEWLDIFVKEHGILRVQAYVECDFPEAVRTVEHLGFHQECTMKNFIGTKPAFLYVKFYKDKI